MQLVFVYPQDRVAKRARSAGYTCTFADRVQLPTDLASTNPGRGEGKPGLEPCRSIAPGRQYSRVAWLPQRFEVGVGTANGRDQAGQRNPVLAPGHPFFWAQRYQYMSIWHSDGKDGEMRTAASLSAFCLASSRDFSSASLRRFALEELAASTITLMSLVLVLAMAFVTSWEADWSDVMDQVDT